MVEPNAVLVAFEQALEKWQEYLAPDVFGWVRQSSVLVNPETMLHLRVIPRQPCIYESNENKRLVLVWPCDMVSIYLDYLVLLFLVYSDHNRKQ